MTAKTGPELTTYTPYQQAFIDQLRKEAGPGSAHRLVAAVGTGKSFGIAGAVAALVKAGRVSRVLVLLPAMLRAQWTQLLRRCDVEAIMLDGRSIRILRNEFVHGVGLPEGVFTMSIDLAKRDDVSEWVSVLPWDFLVVDEAHALAGQRGKLVRALLGKPSPPGVLFATAIVHVDPHKWWVGEVVEIDWREAVEKLLAEQPTDEFLTRTYRRTPDEVAVAVEVVVTARRLGPIKGMSLLRWAASSILSLEESLNRQVGADGPESKDLQVLETLLDSVEGLPTDSKLDCLKVLVAELSQSGIRHAVLFCDYQATLNYLRSTLQGLDLPDLAIHGGMNADERDNAFSQFREDGGFLITTPEASQFLSMRFVEAVVHYDLPLSSHAFSERVGRYLGHGRSIACTAYCLEDEAEALPIEAIQLQIARMPNSDSIELDTDIDALFEKVLAWPPSSVYEAPSE